MRKEASSLLKKKTLKSRLPLITKVADASKLLSEDAYKMLLMDIRATHLYEQKIFMKYGTRIPGEYKHGIILI